MEKLGFKRIGKINSPYSDENGNYLLGYKYELNRADYFEKYEKKVVKNK